MFSDLFSFLLLLFFSFLLFDLYRVLIFFSTKYSIFFYFYSHTSQVHRNIFGGLDFLPNKRFIKNIKKMKRQKQK